MVQSAIPQPAETEDLYPEVAKYIDGLANKDGALIPVLHFAQETYGYLPKEVQLFISRKLGVPAAKVYGVATFYSLFSMEKRGRYRINVCLGTACYVRGSEAVLAEFENELKIKAKETTEDAMFTLDSVRCVGACGLSPVVMVNEKVYGRVSTNDVRSIVEHYLAEGHEEA